MKIDLTSSDFKQGDFIPKKYTCDGEDASPPLSWSGVPEGAKSLALIVDDFAAAHALHEKMGCICYENQKMGIYFIHDPDDYWIEIIPKR